MVAKAIEYILVTYLGIMSNHLSPEMTKQHNLPNGFGLIIQSVSANSPALEAGLLPNDILLQIDQQHIISPYQLRMLIRSHKVGEKIKLTVIRNNKRRTLTAKLGQVKRAKHIPKTSQRIVKLDDRFILHYTLSSTSTSLTAFDKQSKTPKKPIFDGPIDTVAQRKNMPKALTDALDADHKKYHENQKKLNKRDLNFNLKAFDADMKKMRERLLKHRGLMGLDLNQLRMNKLGQNNLEANVFTATSVMHDDEHIISLTVSNDGKTVKATDLKHKLIFEGPLNSKKRLQKSP